MAKEQGTLQDKLGELEGKIRALISEIVRSREEKKILSSSIKDLENKLAAMEEVLNSERSEREKLELQLKQRAEEREELRAKVEGLLAEVSRMESSLGD
jgi:chromosome segregation ATPase